MANDPDSSNIVDDSIPSPVSENLDFPPPSEDADLPYAMTYVEIINYHLEAVCFFTISPSEGEVWGENWLADGEILYPGSRITFNIKTGFLFDWVAQSCDGEMLVEAYELSQSEGMDTWRIRS